MASPCTQPGKWLEQQWADVCASLLLFLFLQLGPDGSHSIRWCSQRSIKNSTSHSILSVTNLFFFCFLPVESVLIILINGQWYGDIVNWLANRMGQWSASACKTTLQNIPSAKKSLCLWCEVSKGTSKSDIMLLVELNWRSITDRNGVTIYVYM